MSSVTINTLGLMAGLAGLAVGQINKPSAQPPFDVWWSMDDANRANIPTVSWTSSHWSSGWIPETCTGARDGWLSQFSPWDFDVLNVTYSDCRDPWVICRHKQSPLSEQDIFTVSSGFVPTAFALG